MKLNQFELRREIFHILTGISIFLLLMFVKYSEFILFFALIIGIILSFAVMKARVPIISRMLKLFEREKNMNLPGKGLLFFVAGALFVFVFYERSVALASILILTLSDPVAHFVGENFGKTKVEISEDKNIEGSLAGILLATIGASFVVGFEVGFIGAILSGIIEFLDVKIKDEKIDDNFLVPAVSGFIMNFLIRFI